MDTTPHINHTAFFRRFNHLLNIWKDTQRQFHENQAMILFYGRDDPEAMLVKTEALQVWLLGYSMPDSLFVFTQKSVFFLAGNRKIQILEALKENTENQLALHFHTKTNQSNVDTLKLIKDALVAELGDGPLKIMLLTKEMEKQVGPFSQEVDAWLKELNHTPAEMGTLVQEALCIKEAEEMETIKHSAALTQLFQNKVIEEVERIIDEEISSKHSEISNKIEKILDEKNEKELKNIEKQLHVESQYVDFAYVPVVQSGGQYDLKPSAQSNSSYLSYDTIICSAGAKYKEYNSNVVRTLFINPDKGQRANYMLVFELEQIVISKLKPGTTLKAVFDFAYNHASEKKKDILENLPNNFGYGVGLEFRESNLMINSKNEKVIEPGMVFNVVVSLSNLKSAKGKPYAIMLADTVVVKQTGTEVLTKNPKKYEDISYALDSDEAPAPKEKPKQNGQSMEIEGVRRTREKATVQLDENQRKIHQEEVKKNKILELEERLKHGNLGRDSKSDQSRKVEDITSYKDPSQFPLKEMKKGQIYVDMKNDCIVLPICGGMVPFHISVIKNVSKQEEGKISLLRLNFFANLSDKATAGTGNLKTALNTTNMLYIRELTFRSANSKNVSEVLKKIKDLQKKIKQKELDRAKEDVKEQEPLQIIKGKRPILQDLKARPNISGKKSQGNLEAHANGFRFITRKQERLDVAFSNIRHAFFQPCDNEMIILLHFNLHTPIMVGKKKVSDVQFYTEAGLAAEDIDMRRSGRNDDDEWESEERERAQRKKLNEEFEIFIRAVENAAKNQIEFDLPYRELGFQGAPFKSHVMLYPTVHCLVNLTESPFFIMNIEEVEWAHFERIAYGLKNFDIAFILKDYSKQVVRINSIPINYLDPVKNWLDKMDIPFTSGEFNIKWPAVMAEVRQTIRENPDEFFEDGGWDFLQENKESVNGEPGAEEEIPEGDSEFSGDESEFDDDDSEVSDSEFDEDEDEVSDFEGEDELEEEGMDWDEMAEMAEKEEETKKTSRPSRTEMMMSNNKKKIKK